MHKISNRIFEIFFKKTLDFLLAGFLAILLYNKETVADAAAPVPSLPLQMRLQTDILARHEIPFVTRHFFILLPFYCCQT